MKDILEYELYPSKRLCFQFPHVYINALLLSKLVEATQAGTMYENETRPTRYTPVALGFMGVKWG